MFNISLAVGAEDRLDVLAQRLCQRVVDIDEILSTAVGNIVSLSRRFMRSETRLQVCLNDIFNIGEVSALPAVAVDGGPLVVYQLLDEFRDDRRVRAVRILPPAEHIEVSQSVGIQPIVHAISSRRSAIS